MKRDLRRWLSLALLGAMGLGAGFARADDPPALSDEKPAETETAPAKAETTPAEKPKEEP